MSLKFCEILLIEVAVSLRYYFLLDELFKYKGFNGRPMANTGLTRRDFLLFTMLQLSNLCWTVTEQEGILEICQWCVLFLNQWDTINRAIAEKLWHIHKVCGHYFYNWRWDIVVYVCYRYLGCSHHIIARAGEGN